MVKERKNEIMVPATRVDMLTENDKVKEYSDGGTDQFLKDNSLRMIDMDTESMCCRMGGSIRGS
jgi:hypothetical protein